MLGIVLCGGQSMRMGSDKGLLVEQDRPWAEIAKEKLNQLDIPVMISVNVQQYQSYAHLFLPEELIADDPSVVVQGPLRGLLSAHLCKPDQDIFLLACDLLLMERRLLEKLLGVFDRHITFDAFIYTRAGQREPLCGIYRSGALKSVLQLMANQELGTSSMKFVLSKLKVMEIPLEEEEVRFFGNFNSPLDRDQLH